MEKKKILVLLAKGFETMEFSVFIDVFGWARNDFQIPIETVTCGFVKTVNSTFNVPIVVDKLIETVQVSDYAALAIPGGFAEYDFYTEAFDKRFLEIIREFENQGKWIATICVAALPLGKSGVLKNRQATTYHLKDAYRQKQLQTYCPNVVSEPIVIDKKIITSYCPETAPHVAFELLEALTSKEQTNAVRLAMGFEKKIS
jgi:4-methyl-5(b-hydroxyethyl)-thiazole monophosphate biosynthesis